MKHFGGEKNQKQKFVSALETELCYDGVPGCLVWLSHIWRVSEWFERLFSDTAIFLSFSHTHKFNLRFLRRHVAQIEYSKKVLKNDFSGCFLALSSARILCGVSLSGNDGVERQSCRSCGWRTKKKKRIERKDVADFQQADFIWFHQTLTADRPSHCRLFTGLPVDMCSMSRVSGA